MDFKGQKTWPCIKGKSGKTTKAQCGLKQHYSWTQCALLCQFSIVVTKVKLTNFRLLLRNRDENDRKLLRLFLTSMILITASGAGSCFLFFLRNKKYDQLFPFKLKLKEKKCRFLPLHGHKTLCDRRLTCQTLKRTKQMIQAKVEFQNGWKKSLFYHKTVCHRTKTLSIWLTDDAANKWKKQSQKTKLSRKIQIKHTSRKKKAALTRKSSVHQSPPLPSLFLQSIFKILLCIFNMSANNPDLR